MDLACAYRKVKGNIEEGNRIRSVKQYFPKIGIPEKERLKAGLNKTYQSLAAAKNAANENKDVIVPLASSVAAHLITCQTGYPFPQFDKIMHYSFGYGASRLGRKIARRLDRNENVSSFLTSLGSALGIELWESIPFINSIGNILNGAVYQNQFSLQTIDPLDIGSGMAGCLTDGAVEYANRAKELILKRFSSKKT